VVGVAVTTVAIVVAVALGARLALRLPLSSSGPTPVVHAERSGLRLTITDLTGRVALVSSIDGVRWRIAGVTPWRRADGRVLARNWDTTALTDGTYSLELRTAAGSTVQRLSVRNVTLLGEARLATATAGLSTRPVDNRSVVAVFEGRSYRPGETAVLKLWGRYPGPLGLQVLRIGPNGGRTTDQETITGGRVGPARLLDGTRSAVRIAVGGWESGLYAVRLEWRNRVGFAPFVVRPAILGKNRVAVVQPTNTWQAYNYRCANGDGIPDTWYYTQTRTAVDLSRPYLDRGVPPHFRSYDLGFLRWLWREHKHVDMLAQEDLERIPGDRLARLYRLIVFPGHHEYVTTAEYDAVQRYRDLGGHLAFLSANNFFYRVDRHGDRIVRIGRWRDMGRPEAALVGVQYFGWNRGTYRAREYVVRGARLEPWLFVGTGLRNGDAVGWWGIEVDGRTTASPRSVHVLASMPRAFGSDQPAEMTYYETRSGARVFAAGAFTLGGDQAMRWTTGKLLENLWNRLAEPAHAAHAPVARRAS
jgi:hypothetical protein